MTNTKQIRQEIKDSFTHKNLLDGLVLVYVCKQTHTPQLDARNRISEIARLEVGTEKRMVIEVETVGSDIYLLAEGHAAIRFQKL